jgi:hypothetical protein
VDVSPGTARYTVEHGPEGLRLVLPVKRHGCIVAFLGVWLLGWAAGEASVLRAMWQTGLGLDLTTLFLLVWFAGWTVGGAVAAGFFALMLDGREIVTVDGEKLHHRIEAFGVGWTRSYRMADIERLRAWTGAGEDSTSSAVRFEYGADAITVLRTDTESVATMLASEILDRYPALGRAATEPDAPA